VKTAQRSPRGTQRTIGRLDFAIIQSYLFTAAKWGISQLHAPRDLVNKPRLDPTRTPITR
jgi:hypothetical protein